MRTISIWALGFIALCAAGALIATLSGCVVVKPQTQGQIAHWQYQAGYQQEKAEQIKKDYFEREYREKKLRLEQEQIESNNRIERTLNLLDTKNSI